MYLDRFQATGLHSQAELLGDFLHPVLLQSFVHDEDSVRTDHKAMYFAGY